MPASERARIELLSRHFGAAATDRVIVGIGDDAAVLAAGSEPLVWTVDACVDGVHFRRDLLELEDIGFRATSAALSDLAAMGATPIGVLAALVLPADFGDDELLRLAEGQRAAARAAGTAVVGGNLSRGGELSITTTALGAAPNPLRRDAARPGDAVFLAGRLGLAAAGLALLEKHIVAQHGGAPLSGLDAGPARAALDAFRRPRPLLAEGVAVRPFARAGIDVSDGLASDLGHLARASDVRVVIEARTVVTDELSGVADLLGMAPLDLALYGGEDYALVIAAPADMAVMGFTRIGRCEPRLGGGALVAVAGPDGVVRDVPERGFDHFGDAAPATTGHL